MTTTQDAADEQDRELQSILDQCVNNVKGGRHPHLAAEEAKTRLTKWSNRQQVLLLKKLLEHARPAQEPLKPSNMFDYIPASVLEQAIKELEG